MITNSSKITVEAHLEVLLVLNTNFHYATQHNTIVHPAFGDIRDTTLFACVGVALSPLSANFCAHGTSFFPALQFPQKMAIDVFFSCNSLNGTFSRVGGTFISIVTGQVGDASSCWLVSPGCTHSPSTS